MRFLEIKISNNVLYQLDRISHYCSFRYGSDFGVKLYNDVNRVVDLLADNPKLYRSRTKEGDRIVPLINGYKLYYRIEDDTVCIYLLTGKGAKDTF